MLPSYLRYSSISVGRSFFGKNVLDIGGGHFSFTNFELGALRLIAAASLFLRISARRVSATCCAGLRLDELPQLWNVMMGDMSFVGPRPLLPVDQPPNSRLRLTVKPGITGWAQIRGGARLGVEEKGEFDDWYVNHASFGLDLWIIARTIHSVIFGDKVTAPQPQSAQPEDLSHGTEREDSLSDVDRAGDRTHARARKSLQHFCAEDLKDCAPRAGELALRLGLVGAR